MFCAGHNMSVLGSQVDVDMDESVPDPVPKHQGHTGTGCYKLHDHEFLRPRHRPPRKGGGAAGGDGGGGGGGPPQVPPTNIMDLPVDAGPPNPVQLNAHNALKTKVTSPAQRTPVSSACYNNYPLMAPPTVIIRVIFLPFHIITFLIIHLQQFFIHKINVFKTFF